MQLYNQNSQSATAKIGLEIIRWQALVIELSLISLYLISSELQCGWGILQMFVLYEDF